MPSCQTNSKVSKEVAMPTLRDKLQDYDLDKTIGDLEKCYSIDGEDITITHPDMLALLLPEIYDVLISVDEYKKGGE